MRAPTAFRTVWLLHSGQLFGLPGVLVVDLVALVFIALAVTGLLIWIFPKIIRRRRGKPEKIKPVAAHLRRSVSWHKALGICTIVLTMLICITGWALRPPVLVGLVKLRMPALPGSALDTPNPWQDKLRMIRYDRQLGRWLISTSEGFYSMPTLSEAPVRIGKQPPVSVMGLNVFAPDGDGWLIGSLSGMYRWNPQSGAATDYFTGQPAPDKPGPPFGLTPVAGYTEALGKPMPVRYDTGTPYPQPEELRHKPMELWQVALETHTGRILWVTPPPITMSSP